MSNYLPVIISAVLIIAILWWWLTKLDSVKSTDSAPRDVAPPKSVPAPPVAAAPPPAAPTVEDPAKLMDDPAPSSKTTPAKAQAPLKVAATKAAPLKTPAKPAQPVAKEIVAPEATAEPKPKPAPKLKAVAKSVIPDNLEILKGVGPKLNTLLKSLGVISFTQIANWSAADIAELDSKLGTFAGRITRDNWVDQAKLLVAGNTAEFEKKYGALGSGVSKG